MSKTQTILVQITGFSFDLVKNNISVELSIQDQIYNTSIDKEIFHDKFFFKIQENDILIINVSYQNQILAKAECNISEILKKKTNFSTEKSHDLIDYVTENSRGCVTTKFTLINDEINQSSLQTTMNYFKKEPRKLSTIVTTSKSGDKYVGKSLTGKRHGKGELHYSNGTKYFGDWKNDKKEGFGIFISKESIYYGNWSLGEKDGMGIEVFEDGTFFDGNWKKGIKSGEGLLKMSNGDSLYGIWNDESVQGIFKKGKLENASNCSIILLKEKLNLLKEHDLSFGVVKSKKLINKWESLFLSYSEVINEQKEKFRSFIFKEIETFVLKKEEIGKQNVKNFVENLCKFELSDIIKTFVDIFYFRYSGNLSVNASLRSQALDDFLSFVDSFHGNILYIVGKESMDIYSEKKMMYWLKNYILKMIYKPLFSIYTKIYQERDNYFKYKILSLSNANPKEMGILESLIPNEKEPYLSSIQILEEISSFQTAYEKFDCLVKSTNEMKKSIDDLTNNQGADDLFPISIFIFVKSKIQNVYSLFKFLQDFADERVIESEQAYRFTVFELILDFIETIDMNIKDTSGTLVPITMFKDQLSQLIRKVFFDAKKTKTAPNLNWISSLFIEIGNYQNITKDLTVSPECLKIELNENEIEILKEILKIVGLKLVLDEYFKITYEMIYPSTVYHQMAQTLEKLMDKHHI